MQWTLIANAYWMYDTCVFAGIANRTIAIDGIALAGGLRGITQIGECLQTALVFLLGQAGWTARITATTLRSNRMMMVIVAHQLQIIGLLTGGGRRWRCALDHFVFQRIGDHFINCTICTISRTVATRLVLAQIRWCRCYRTAVCIH